MILPGLEYYLFFLNNKSNKAEVNLSLYNVINNAYDAIIEKSSEDIGNITIRLNKVDGLVEMAIKDDGVGMSEETNRHALDPFYTTKGVGQGTGMGLSVVYGIVENYGGHILVETEVGKGSRLHMLFPPITETASPVTDSDKESTMLTIVHGENILVVDDEKSIAMLLKEILSNHGYQPIAVTDSTEALTLFKADPDKFDMLITDQTMPKLTGIELITQLREIRPNLPAILCTGFSDKISDIEAENQNIQFFNKPVDTNMLIQKIALLFSANHEKKVDNLV